MLKSIMQIFFVLILVNAICLPGLAAVRIPRNLDDKDRQAATRILGWGTAGKLLADPFPLGGYSGLEIGVSIVSVPVDDLSRLGAKNVGQQDDFTYPKISIGKGLYNNIDTWLHFIPYSEASGLSEYGGIVRWCFVEAKFFPGTFSLVAHGNAANITNTFSSQTAGADLITGINIGNIGFYLGGGKVYSTARFIGGATGVTDTLRDEITSVEGFHSVLGGSLKLQNLFGVLQIDLYTQPIFSTKIGIKF